MLESNNGIGIYRYTKTPEDTVAAALKGGTDLNCGSFYQKNGQVSTSMCDVIILL